jgi:tetratricopeptide (TPR) repeat protein
LSAFPEKTRTPAQTFLLGNILFEQDAKASYALHKKAAADLPNESQVLFEWAIEQHRAGEYASAAASYAEFIKANPKHAPAMGLAAETLIRTGKTREAVDMWLASEKATEGTLEDLESLVCDVNSHLFPDRDRAALIAKVKTGDIAAAEQLIALDCRFERDWWNHGPRIKYLEHDLKMLQQTIPNTDPHLEELLCAGECELVNQKEGGDVAAVLRKYGFLLDDKSRLPKSSRALSVILGTAFYSHAISKKQAREKWGQTILEQAKASKDPEMFNVAANLFVGTDQLADIDQAGWDATGDVRFAASLMVGLMGKEKLSLEDPLLMKASKQFPEDAEIAGIVLALTAKAGKPVQSALINAIKAEYTHFSLGHVGVDFPRPRAETLAAYFKMLDKELAAK